MWQVVPIIACFAAVGNLMLFASMVSGTSKIAVGVRLAIILVAATILLVMASMMTALLPAGTSGGESLMRIGSYVIYGFTVVFVAYSGYVLLWRVADEARKVRNIR